MDDSREVFGTAFKVDGTWYVRYLHGGGVLIPLEAPAELRASLVEGQMYRFEGYIGKNHLGCAERCHAKFAEAIGRTDQA